MGRKNQSLIETRLGALRDRLASAVAHARQAALDVIPDPIEPQALEVTHRRRDDRRCIELGYLQAIVTSAATDIADALRLLEQDQ